MTLPEKIRAFVALEMPAEIVSALVAVQARLRRELPEVSWTRAEAMHLTLHFFGNVPSAQVGPITDALAGVAGRFQPFDLSVSGIGSFGSRVIWAGLGGGVETLQALAGDVRRAVGDFGEHQEEREYSGHITLGRLRQRGAGLAARLRGLADTPFGSWRVSGLKLIRSELSPHGARYTVLSDLPLRT